MGAMSIEDQYRDMLDDAYGEVSICGLTYSASVALERVDPIAYRVGLSEFDTEGEEVL